tara:strand:+ start:84 stop:617 length:534 start_codon:yes stop_codon:yes gene_type:complete
MKVTALKIPDVKLIEPEVFEDNRGYFYELFNEKKFNELLGKTYRFTQDNCAYSKKNVLRGLHYQLNKPQAKLITVTSGKIFDVAVDIRKHSPTYGKYVSAILSSENKSSLFLPEGFSHGYLVLSDFAEIQYKVNKAWDAEDERIILWNDESINIDWPIKDNLILSKKDMNGLAFKSI